MCGFVGISGESINFNKFQNAVTALKDRGPDYVGFYQNDSLCIGHTRLAILDLNERSNQPFWSSCRGLICLFNGEIYNYRELQELLIGRGIKLRTDSDTEVILELFKLEGIEFVKRLEGMYSIAIIATVTEEIYCFRDPLGIKPFYYSVSKGGFYFGSQVSALNQIVETEVNRNSEKYFELLGSILQPETYKHDILSLTPGNYLYFKKGRLLKNPIQELNFKKLRVKRKSSFNELVAHINDSLLESIRRHVVSDVPIALFLSGGLDSAYLATRLKSLIGDKLTAITIAFNDSDENSISELASAQLIAKRLGIKHESKLYTKKDFVQELPRILSKMDQPTIDGINTYFASKFAAELGFKVVISGVGGDELLSGYKYYRTPMFVVNSTVISRLLKGVIVPIKNKSGKLSVLPLGLGNWSSYWLLRRSRPPNDVTNYKNFLDNIHTYFRTTNIESPVAAQELDIQHYLGNQLLRDSDWASMAHSVELRTPLVDYKLYKDVLEYRFMISKYGKQRIFGSLLENDLPKEILKSGKKGFAIPTDSWSKSAFNLTWAEKVEEYFYRP